ncbi:MAG: S-methyl-5-thioribose-1-phosphate isomerase [Phycisphaerales bacterium]|nr:S-methyl-5-thioribose-1-phosphate isomerase [Phycisphaerales bacterium]
MNAKGAGDGTSRAGATGAKEVGRGSTEFARGVAEVAHRAAFLPRSIEWVGGLDGFVSLIDQTLLPSRLEILQCHDVDTVIDAIRRLAVRGAPAIGIAAAMGLVLGVRDFGVGIVGDARNATDAFSATDARNTTGARNVPDTHDARALLLESRRIADRIAAARPTAVNLFWALQRMLTFAEAQQHLPAAELKERLLAEAKAIRDEDARMCRAIGERGADLIGEGCGVLTYCNAGALATAEWGTALAPLYVAHERGRRFTAYAPETRPLLQGSRLTAWELSRAGIDVRVLCDGAVGALMRSGRVQLVITGADRIAASGDTANKIGTYSVACLAAVHGIPFYVAAPSSTFDLATPDGERIPIEERSAEEVRGGPGRWTAPPDVVCLNPAFDVTPARLIRGILTERGLIEPVKGERILAAMG